MSNTERSEVSEAKPKANVAVTKLYLVEETIDTMMSGEYREVIGVYSLIQLAEEAVLKRINEDDYKRVGNIWYYHFDGETTYGYDIQEIALDMTVEDYYELNSREVPDGSGDETSGIVTKVEVD